MKLDEATSRALKPTIIWEGPAIGPKRIIHEGTRIVVGPPSGRSRFWEPIVTVEYSIKNALGDLSWNRIYSPSPNTPPTPDELADMNRVLRRALTELAFEGQLLTIGESEPAPEGE